MNTSPPANTHLSASEAIRAVGWKPLAALALITLLLPGGVLLAAAGTLNWPMAWLYAGVSAAFGVGGRILILRTTPDLLVERGRFLRSQGAKSWDKVIVSLVGIVGPVAMFIVAGLDRRLGWTAPAPLALQLGALAAIVLGYLLSTWAVLTNRFFSGVVRIQTDRGHTVVTGGPYRFVRHPGYAGSLLAYLASPLALGSLWMFIPAGLTALLLVVRTALEDRTLRAELEGYAAYTRQTRYRLLPGVW